MSVKITRDKNRIAQKIAAGKRAATIAVTEAIIEYGNIYVREDQGTLMDSAFGGEPAGGGACYMGHAVR